MLSSIRSGSVALTLLDQTSAAAAGARDGSDRIGPLGQAAKPGGARPGAAAGTALFSVEELVKRPRRIGQVFGIARDPYATQANDMTAVGAAFTRLLEKPNDATLIEAIAGRLHVDGDAVAVPTRQNSP